MPKTSKTNSTARLSRSAKVTPKRPVRSALKDSQAMMDKPMSNETSRNSRAPMNMNNKQMYILLTIAIIAGLLYYFRSAFVVAMVNGSPVTRVEVIKELEMQGGKGALDSIISERLLRQEAKKANIVVEQSEIDKRIKGIEDELKSSGQTLEQVLEQQGLTREQVENQTELQLILRKVLADKIKVTDEEVKKAFDEQKASKPEGVTDEDFTKQIRDTLENQKLSFEAQTYIQELQTKAKIQYWRTY